MITSRQAMDSISASLEREKSMTLDDFESWVFSEGHKAKDAGDEALSAFLAEVWGTIYDYKRRHLKGGST